MAEAIDFSQHRAPSSSSLHTPQRHGQTPSITLIPPPLAQRLGDRAESSDPFRHARLDNARRSTTLDAIPSSQSLPTLSAYQQQGGEHASMEYRPARPLDAPREPSAKGKERSISNSPSAPNQQSRGQWVFDIEEASLGAETWAQRDRIILVTGSPTPHNLAPLLLDPAYSSTHILIGVSELAPEIDQLVSTSQISIDGVRQAVYPSLQVFTVPAPAGSTAAHVLPTVINHATLLARAHRSSSGAGTPRRVTHSRRESDSSNSTTPPLTPPSRVRKLSNFGMKLERVSTDSSRVSITRSTSDFGLGSALERPTSRSRMSSFNRQTVFGGLVGSGVSDSRVSSGSPFDAVLNFIPSARDFAYKAELQGMLHQAVVLTTGILPILTQTSAIKSLDALNCPAVIPLLHILPSMVPAPLPGIIESFLLNLLPTFAGRTDGDIFAAAVTPGVWRQAVVDSTIGLSGASILLSGGARCPDALCAGRGIKSRALLSTWRDCVPMPGIMAESRVPSTPASFAPVAERTHSAPLSISYSSVSARTPPQTIESPIRPPTESEAHTPVQDSTPASPGRNNGTKLRINSRLRDLAFSDLTIAESMPTPDLDPSPSSSSSWSGSPETDSEANTSATDSRSGSQTGHPRDQIWSRDDSPEGAETISPLRMQKDKTGWKAVGGWFKRKAREAS